MILRGCDSKQPDADHALVATLEVTIAQHDAWEEEKKDDSLSKRRYGETYSLGVRTGQDTAGRTRKTDRSD